MNKIKIIIFFLLIVGNLFSQDISLIPSKGSNGLWGAVNATNKEVIPFAFDKVSFYSFGYFLVELDGKKGLFNSEGNKVISLKYDAIRPIDKNTFQVFVGGKTGVVNKREIEILPTEFNSILFREGSDMFIVSKNRKYSIYSKKGKQQTPFSFDNISFYGDKHFLYTKDSKFAVHKGIASLSDLKFYDDIVRKGECFLVRDGSNWGVLNSSCDVIIKIKYDAIELFGSDQYFKVKKNNNYAFFDLKGEKLTRYEFSNPIFYFENNVCWHQVEEDWYRYNFVTKQDEPLNITRIIDVVNGYTRVVNNNYVELVDSTESTLFGGKYHDVIPLSNNLFKVQYMRKWGVVNIYGDQIIDVAFDKIVFNTVDVKEDSSSALFDVELKNKEDKIYSESFTVSNKGKVGVYSIKGEEVVPVVFEEVEASVYNLMIRAKSKGKYNVYNRQGVRLFDDNYKSIDWSENQKYFTLFTDTTIAVSDTLGVVAKLKNMNSVKWSLKNDLFFDKQDDFYGLRNIDSDTIIEYKYKDIYDLNEDYFVGVVDSGVFIFNSNGAKVINDKIKSIEVVDKNEELCFVVFKDDSFGVLNSKGETIIPFEYSRITFDKDHDLFRVEKNSKFVGYISLDGNKYF